MTRTEHDSLGKVEVPEDKLWGAQTQRSLENFKIGEEVFPPIFIKNYAILKKAAAFANKEVGGLSAELADRIALACDSIIKGELPDEFPLKIWQTGSGTQTNMNLNEVIANKCAQLANEDFNKKSVHPNDHVNKSQSSNDSFPVAMAMSSVEATGQFMMEAKKLIDSFYAKAREFDGEIKIGRTHLMDAVPMSCGQEFDAWGAQLEQALNRVEAAKKEVLSLPLGGTAIGTGLNASEEFSKSAVAKINELTGESFELVKNKFSKIAAHDDIANLSAAFRNFAQAFHKIANDIRLLGSGPRCGLSELLLPENEPGSSIMPGKVNPTQCEAATMVCAQVMGNDAAVSFGAANGQLQLNTYKPLIARNTLDSARLLKDMCLSFRIHCLDGIKINSEKLKIYNENSLMLVTALTPKLGYEKCSKIAQKAYQNGTTIREEVLREGLMSEEDFEKAVDLKILI